MPPSTAVNIYINKTSKEKVTAVLSDTPNLVKINTMVFSLIPRPPMEIRIPVKTNITVTIRRKVIKLKFRPSDKDKR